MMKRQTLMRRFSLNFLLFTLVFANPSIFLIVRAQGQKEKTPVASFPVPIQWQTTHMKLGSKAKPTTEKFTSGLSANLPVFVLADEVQTYLYEQNLTPANEGIKISSERGELVSRLLNEASPNSVLPPNQQFIRFLTYGQIDGVSHAYVYEFIYDENAKQLLKGSVTNLQGDGYEADYQTGQVFALHDAGVQAIPLASLADINCLIKNILSCSSFVSIGYCVITAGTGCLHDFLKAILFDLVCGITMNCQPITQDFSLHASPEVITITQGQSAHFLIGVTFTGGFSPVSGFAVSNLPSGASRSFNAGSIAAPGDAVTLTISTNTSTATGTRTLTVSATGAGKTRTKNVVLVVNPAPNSGVTTLSNGQAVTGSLAKSQVKHYKINVPPSTSQLKVEMTGTNDADLYLKYGFQASLNSWDCRPYAGGSNEQCTVNSPAAGDYFIMVNGFSSATSSYTLKATVIGNVTNPTPNITKIIPLTNPVPNQQFIARIEGSGFNSSNARVVATGPGCPSFGPCAVPNNVINGKSSNVLTNVPLTLGAGTYQIYVQNGTGGPVSAPRALTVSSGSSAPILVVDGVVSNGGIWPGTNFNVPAGRSLMKVTLSWSGGDDLDLHLTSPNGTHYGYQGVSPSGYSYSANPEVMQFPNPQSGFWNVKVRGYSVSTSRTFTVRVYTQ